MKKNSPGPFEPLAIVGIGCRLPGDVFGPKSYWDLLCQGRSGIVEVPPTRWNRDRFYHPDPSVPGRMISDRGGFVEGIDQFDAKFWGISPREATRMDPQQRWLLEVAWEAIEDAGVPPATLRGSTTGVFVGVSANDYSTIQLHDNKNMDVHSNSGGALSIASNRISYMLDLKGPSMSVDTACSSSLTASVLACQHIWAGRCCAALAGGVNALLMQQASIGFSKASMLSPSGQCYAFDKRADGYVRSEGAGIVMIKPLAAALRDANSVYAVIRAAVANQDGHTSSMTVPGVESQSAMLRQACEDAGISPREVCYIEAHGTGTLVGDPIEARAIGNVLGEGRPSDEPCLMGSVKANIGHLESASGIAGLIKTALVLQHGVAPANANFETPNPNIPFEALGLKVVRREQPLPSFDSGSPLAAINSFGFGGANAHLILESPPVVDPRPWTGEQPDRPYLLPLSARDDESLRNYAKAFRSRLDDSTVVADLCWSAAERKQPHSHRAVMMGGTARELRESINDFLQNGDMAERAVIGLHRGNKPSQVSAVFTGQGVQWWAMGQQLIQREPLFRRMIEEIDACLAQLADWSLMEEMTRSEATSNIDRTDIAQPAIFALQSGLVELWKSWGVTPARVVGHSVGEVAAAYCAGIYSLQDAATVIFHRSRLQEQTRGNGGMLAAGISAAVATQLIGDDADRVQVAAINSPELVTISGDTKPLARIEAQLEQQGDFVRRLRVNYPFHTHHMDSIRTELLEVLSGISPQPSRIPFISTVTGNVLDGQRLDAEYWWRNVRHPVLFAPAVRSMIDGGDDVFLEIGPHPALQSSVVACLEQEGREGKVFCSLQRKQDESQSLIENVARLHIAGVKIDWASLNRSAGNPISLPRYPWHHESYWLDQGNIADRLLAECHPLLGIRVHGATPTWKFSLDPRVHTYLNDHRLWDAIVFPGAGYGEMGLAVARELFPNTLHAVEDLEIKKALFVSDDKPPQIRIAFNSEDKSYRVYSEPEDDGAEWDLNARGRLVAMETEAGDAIDLDALKSRLPDQYGRETFYARLTDIGFQFGRDFQHITRVWRTPGESLCEVVASENVRQGLDSYLFHPALMDASFQASRATMVVAEDTRPEDFFYLPSSVRRIRCYSDQMPDRLWAHAVLRKHDGKSFVCDIQVTDGEGRRLAEILGFEATLMDRAGSEPWSDCLYQIQWVPGRLHGSRLTGPSDLACSQEILDVVEAARPDAYEQFKLASFFQRYEPAIVQLTDQIIENAMVELHWDFKPGQRVDLDTVIDRLGISAQQHRLMAKELKWLSEMGVLKSDGQQWVVRRLPQFKNIDREFDRLLEEFPSFAADLDLVRSVLPQLAAVLSGDADPVEVMFPNGSSERLDRFYSQSSELCALNTLLREAVCRSLASLPSRRAVRILEVGAGTGSLTESVIEALPRQRCEYVFTDIGPAFVNRAKIHFGDQSFMEFRTFDVERPPEEQGLAPGSVDIILASNVLHATRDLRVTLANLKSCLAPGGLLMFLDVTRLAAYLDNTFGVLKGWWRFEDDLRSDSPLLLREQWRTLLSECGFEDVRSFTSTLEQQEGGHEAFLAHLPVGEADLPAARSEAADDSTSPDSTADAVASDVEKQVVVVLCDEGGVGEATASHLASDYQIVTARAGGQFEKLDQHRFVVRPDSTDDLRQLLAESGAVHSVLHHWSLDHPDVLHLDGQSLSKAQTTGALSALALVQALVGRTDGSPKAYFITRQAVSVGEADKVHHIASSPLAGVIRVAANEHPDIRWKIIDLGQPSRWEAQDLADELRLCDDELEAAYRDGVRYVRRVARARIAELPKPLIEAVRDGGQVVPYRLETDKPGVLANLSLHETPRPDPSSDQVEVRLMAGGINFRDVMKALGIHPGNPIDLLWFGDDFAGVVERVGENVTDIKVGDEVAGMSPGVFRAYATVNRNLLFKKPPQLSFEQTATLPTVFLTAHYALNYLARMQAGERILVHAGTGGVGQAAIQIAKRLGLEIFATAGTSEKRQVLRAMGVQHAMNSRTLAFADQVMEITAGQGVDAVLNSLAGEFIPKSFSVLAPFGRFLEIGKVDIYNNTKLGMQCLKANITYYVIDLAQHLEKKPEMVARMFSELAERFASGHYGPLTYKVFPITEVVKAFRYMAQGKHIGKNVLSFQAPSIPIGPCTEDGRRFRGDGTYLITGGAGGFGLEVAKWMAAQGAGRLALVSRSGPRADALETIQQLRAGGVDVIDARADVTTAVDVERVLGEIQCDSAPLRGVIHGAMVLEDEFLVDLNSASFSKAMDPKMLGAWNLHQATLGLPLEHFVCFSSFSAMIGGGRQANYNAGNVFLESLTHYRHAQGLPALAINWGTLLGAGAVERDQKTAEYLGKIGAHPFDIHEALEIFGELMLRDPVQLAAARLDWSLLGQFTPEVQNSPTFAAFVGGREQGGGALRPRLLAASPTERKSLIEGFVAQQVAGVFGIEVSNVDRQASLSDLGLDSLMAVELMSRVESELGMKVPMGKVLSGPSVAELSTILLDLLGESDAGASAAAGPAAAGDLPPLEDVQMRRLALSDLQSMVWQEGAELHVCAAAVAGIGPQSLQSALAQLTQVHPLLTASIVRQDGQWWLDLAANRAAALHSGTCQTGPLDAGEVDKARRPLTAGEPLARVRLLHNSAGDDLVLLAAHPAIADRWSCALMLRDLISLCANQPVVGSARHYSHYMQWQRQVADSEQLSGAVEYWRKSLTGASCALSLAALELSHANGAATERWAAKPFCLDAETSLRTIVAAAQRDISLAAMLQTALTTALYCASGQQDLMIATNFPTRTHPELKRAAGPFDRLLPVRSVIDATKTLGDLAKTIDQSLRDGANNQHVPSSRLSRELGLTQPLETVCSVSIAVYGCQTHDSSFEPTLAAGRSGGRMVHPQLTARSIDVAPAAPVSGSVSLVAVQGDGDIQGWWQHRLDECSTDAVTRLNDLFGKALQQLLEAPHRSCQDAVQLTSEECRMLDAVSSDRGTMIPGEPLIDFDAEAQLDEAIAPPSAAPARDDGPRRVLLTGATGFLGAFLLDRLLRRTDTEITCLVRADDAAHAHVRIQANLAKYELDPPGQERIIAVAGDLAQPQMGLSSEQFDHLANRLDEIYHNGANTNLALSYRALTSNVAATREILRLAGQTRAKRLHYVSTFTVLSTNHSRGRLVRESDKLPDGSSLLHGYAQTKWVSERMVSAAAQRGLPTVIYRPGHITGESRSGASNMGDLLHTMVLSSAEMGIAPIRDSEVDLTPVDYVADALVEISLRADSVGGTYHLTNPSPLKNSDFVAWMVESGIEIELVPYSAWQKQYTEFCSQDPMLKVVAELVAPRILDAEGASKHSESMHPVFDTSQARAMLESSGIRCPVANEELLSTYADYLLRLAPDQFSVTSD